MDKSIALAGIELKGPPLVIRGENVAVCYEGPLLCLALQSAGIFFAQIRGGDAVERGLHGTGGDLEWLKEKSPKGEHQSGYQKKCLHQIAPSGIGQMQCLVRSFKQALPGLLECRCVPGSDDPALEFFF